MSNALLLLALAIEASAAWTTQAQASAASTPPRSCAVEPEQAQPVAAAGRRVYCAIDIGSRNVKLAVISMEPGKPLTLRDERTCRTRLNLGTKVYDAGAPAGRQDKPLPAADVEALAGAMKRYQAFCDRDGGLMVGADATEWARHATNIAEVKRAVASATGIGIDVLTPDEEARYGYAAATRGRGGYLVVDPGSNSFQVTAQPRGEQVPRGISVPLGYEQASTLYFSKAASYETGRLAYAGEVRRRLAALDMPGLRAAVASGKLGRALVALGQDAAVQLVVGGALRDAAGSWLQDEAAYASLADQVRSTPSPEYGEVTAILEAAQISGFLHSLGAPSQLAQLLADPVRPRYGNKALVVPALLDVLTSDLGVDKVVLTATEMPAGYILAKAARRP